MFDELKAAQISQTPDNVFAPRTKSLLVGLIAALLTLIFLSFLSLVRKTVKKEAVIEEQLQTTLLGTIYHEEKNRTIKAKVVQRVKSLLITSPIITSKFIDTVPLQPTRNDILFHYVRKSEGRRYPYCRS